MDWRLRERGRECCWICSVKDRPGMLSIGTVCAVAVEDVVRREEFCELLSELLDNEDLWRSTVESGDSDGELKA